MASPGVQPRNAADTPAAASYGQPTSQGESRRLKWSWGRTRAPGKRCRSSTETSASRPTAAGVLAVQRSRPRGLAARVARSCGSRRRRLDVGSLRQCRQRRPGRALTRGSSTGSDHVRTWTTCHLRCFKRGSFRPAAPFFEPRRWLAVSGVYGECLRGCGLVPVLRRLCVMSPELEKHPGRDSSYEGGLFTSDLLVQRSRVAQLSGNAPKFYTHTSPKHCSPSVMHSGASGGSCLPSAMEA